MTILKLLRECFVVTFSSCELSHFSCGVICFRLLLQGYFLCMMSCSLSAYWCICASTAMCFELFCNLTYLPFLLQNNNPKSVVGFWPVMMARQQDSCQLITSKSWAKEEVGKRWIWKGLQSNRQRLPARLLEDPPLLRR